MPSKIEQGRNVWDRPLLQEFLGVGVALVLVWLISLATGGFLWMAGVVVLAEAGWLLVRFSRKRRVR